MKKLNSTKWMFGAVVLAGAMLINTAPAMAQDYGDPNAINYAAAGQLDSLVSRIALYPDPLLAQIFAAAAFPDQIAAAAQGSGGPFDPSVEALLQYPTVLQMMASDPGWTQALGQAVMQDEGAVMDEIQNLRREAQQYGYLQSGPQMQVVDDGGYIDIVPVGGYMYVPIYDPYVVFARPRPGFFVGGAIRFGGGFHWVGGTNRFDWGRHQVFVNRRVWTPPARPNRPVFTGGNREGFRNYTAPVMQAPTQRSFAPEQPGRSFGSPSYQHNVAPPQPQPQQRGFGMPQGGRDFGRGFTAPRQMERPSFAPQPHNQGGVGRGRGR
jgi:hypothetical protein